MGGGLLLTLILVAEDSFGRVIWQRLDLADNTS